MRPLMLIALPATLIACGSADALNEEDSQQAFAAMNTVSTDVQTQAYASMGSAAKDLTVSGDASSYSYSGTLDGGAGWTGTVTVDGDASVTGDSYSFDFSLEYDKVDVGGTILDGVLDWTVDASYGQTGYTYTYAMVGDLDVSGNYSGSMDFDYSLSVSIDSQTGNFTYEASGDINGYDVSGWTTTGAGAYGY